MNIISFLIPCALFLGIGFGVSFILATAFGQFEDLETPAHRMLLDDELNQTIELESKTNLTQKKEMT